MELDAASVSEKPGKYFLAFGAILALVFIGYLSNLISSNVCREKAIQEVTQIVNAQSISRGKSIVWINEEDVMAVSCEDAWGENCNFKLFNVEIQSPWFFPDRNNYMPKQSSIEYFEGDGSNPYAYIKMRKWNLPFIVTVPYGWMAGALWGRGGVKYYLCLFGFVSEIEDASLWIS